MEQQQPKQHSECEGAVRRSALMRGALHLRFLKIQRWQRLRLPPF